MPTLSDEPDRVQTYLGLVAEAGTTLDDQLKRIRDDYERREIDIREAADERIQVMTEHLDRLRLLRAEFLS
jgi:hypothetical protein